MLYYIEQDSNTFSQYNEVMSVALVTNEQVIKASEITILGGEIQALRKKKIDHSIVLPIMKHCELCSIRRFGVLLFFPAHVA